MGIGEAITKSVERAEVLEVHLRNTVSMLNAAIRICRTDRDLWPDLQVDTWLGIWTEQVKASMALIAQSNKEAA